MTEEPAQVESRTDPRSDSFVERSVVDLKLATQAEVEDLFHDCHDGAIPALGSPYRIPTVYDDSLAGLADVYFEAGDHDDVVHMSGDAFLDLLSGSLHGRFSRALASEPER